MKQYQLPSLCGALFVLSIVSGATLSHSQTASSQEGDHAKTSVQSNYKELINDWPSKPKEGAMTMIQKYGPPNKVTPTHLIWHHNGPWKRTIVYRDEIAHDFPMPHSDFVEQTIDFRVPPKKVCALAEYDGSVIVERTKGEMSARCDKEEMNLLALNLANDIITDKRSVKEARDFYAKTAMAFKMGEKPPYTQSLQFPTATGGTNDPDKPAMMNKKTSRR